MNCSDRWMFPRTGSTTLATRQRLSLAWDVTGGRDCYRLAFADGNNRAARNALQFKALAGECYRVTVVTGLFGKWRQRLRAIRYLSGIGA